MQAPTLRAFKLEDPRRVSKNKKLPSSKVLMPKKSSPRQLPSWIKRSTASTKKLEKYLRKQATVVEAIEAAEKQSSARRSAGAKKLGDVLRRQANIVEAIAVAHNQSSTTIAEAIEAPGNQSINGASTKQNLGERKGGAKKTSTTGEGGDDSNSNDNDEDALVFAMTTLSRSENKCKSEYFAICNSNIESEW